MIVVKTGNIWYDKEKHITERTLAVKGEMV